MKHIILILSSVLTFVLCGVADSMKNNVQHEFDRYSVSSVVVQIRDNNSGVESLGLLPIQASNFSSTNGSIFQNIRSFNSGRRIQPSGKSSSRLVKSGKLKDRNTFYSFQTDLKQFCSGIHTTGRYIHSICCLLIQVGRSVQGMQSLPARLPRRKGYRSDHQEGARRWKRTS